MFGLKDERPVADMRMFFMPKRKLEDGGNDTKKPVSFACFHCSASFATVEERNAHVYDTFAPKTKQPKTEPTDAQLRAEHRKRISSWLCEATDGLQEDSTRRKTESMETTVRVLQALRLEGKDKSTFSERPFVRLLEAYNVLSALFSTTRTTDVSLVTLIESLSQHLNDAEVYVKYENNTLSFLQRDAPISLATLLSQFQSRILGLDAKLHHKWTTSFDELRARCLAMFVRGYTQQCLGELVLALCLTTGCRRKEILDASIEFHEMDEMFDGLVHFGTPTKRHVTLTLRNAALLNRRMLRQRGVAKSKLVNPLVVLKPSLFLTVEEVLRGVEYVRAQSVKACEQECNAVFRRTFHDMVHFGDVHGTHYSAHSMRGLYARACFGMFVRRGVDEHVFTAAVLGHASDLKGSIHYLTTHVDVAKPWFAMSETEQEMYVCNTPSVKKEPLD